MDGCVDGWANAWTNTNVRIVFSHQEKINLKLNELKVSCNFGHVIKTRRGSIFLIKREM